MPDDAVLRVEAVVVLARQVEHLARHAAPLQRRERGDALYNTCHTREAGGGRHHHAWCMLTHLRLDEADVLRM